MRDKIDVAKNVSLVKNSHYSFPTRDAINSATDSTGTVIDPDKVKASQDEVLSNNAGKHKIKFSYGKARAHIVVEVRSNAHEGVAKANKTEQAGKAASSWFKHYKTSGIGGQRCKLCTRNQTTRFKKQAF